MRHNDGVNGGGNDDDVLNFKVRPPDDKPNYSELKLYLVRKGKYI